MFESPDEDVVQVLKNDEDFMVSYNAALSSYRNKLGFSRIERVNTLLANQETTLDIHYLIALGVMNEQISLVVFISKAYLQCNIEDLSKGDN